MNDFIESVNKMIDAIANCGISVREMLRPLGVDQALRIKNQKIINKYWPIFDQLSHENRKINKELGVYDAVIDGLSYDSANDRAFASFLFSIFDRRAQDIDYKMKRSLGRLKGGCTANISIKRGGQYYAEKGWREFNGRYKQAMFHYMNQIYIERFWYEFIILRDGEVDNEAYYSFI